MKWTLSPEQMRALWQAELRTTPMRELEAELEWLGTKAGELEERILAGDPDDVELAGWGLQIDGAGALAKAELERRIRLGRRLQGPLYSREWIWDLKCRIHLPEFIVGMHDGTGLKRTGSHYVGLCPYHVEDTASLHVWDDHYKCFGCGEYGDVFDWLLKKACGSFREAVEYAARYVGIALPAIDRRTVLGAYDR